MKKREKTKEKKITVFLKKCFSYTLAFLSSVRFKITLSVLLCVYSLYLLVTRYSGALVRLSDSIVDFGTAVAK